MPRCGHEYFRARNGIPRDQVEIEIKKTERKFILHDLECAGYGHVRASKQQIVPRTILGPRGVAFVGAIEHHCHATAGQVSGVLSDTAGIQMGRYTAAGALNAAVDCPAERAMAIRQLEEISPFPTKVKARDRTAVVRESEDDCESPPGTGKNRRRLEYKDGWARMPSATTRSVSGSRRAAARPCSRGASSTGSTYGRRTMRTLSTACGR